MSYPSSGQRMRGFSRCFPLVLAVACFAVSGQPMRAEDAKPAKAKLPADLALVPEDASAFVCLHMGPYWNGTEAKSLQKITQAHPVVPTWWTNDLDKEIGLSMADIERVVMVIPDIKEINDVFFLLTTRKAFDRAKVFAALLPEAKEEKMNGKTYYVSHKNGRAARVVNERVLLAGMTMGVKRFLSGTPSKEKGLWRSTLAEAAVGKHLLVVGVNPSTFRAAVKNAGEQGKPFVPVFEAKSWRIIVDANKDLQLYPRLDFANEATAKEAQKTVQAGVKPLIDYLTFTEKSFEAFYKREGDKYKGVTELSSRFPKLFESTRTALKDFKSEQKGSTVQGTLRIKTDEPATSFVLLLTLMPRAVKK